MTRSAVGRAYARAGLLGNPSDSFGGKTIAFSVTNFSARVSIEPAGRFEITDGLAAPLIEAALRRFAAYTGEPTARLRISLETDVPFQVGLAGSSAIVIATLRALAEVHGRPLDPFDQSELALAVEVDDLGIAAGPQDRVIQAYEGLRHMDFANGRSPAAYTELEWDWLPPMLIAWDPRGGKTSNAVHSDVRERWQRGDVAVRRKMARFSKIVDSGAQALRAGDFDQLRAAVDQNFDARAALYPISESDREMVDLARSRGAAAKQCGSGGACLAVPGPDTDVDALVVAYGAAGYLTVRPTSIP